MKYLNIKNVPQLFIAATGMKWGDPKNFPWTMAFLPSQKTGTAGYVHYLLKERPDAKIAVLYQNDDFGKDLLNGLKEGLGEDADKMIVSAQNFQSTDPTIDSQIVKLKASGANVLFMHAIPKHAAQAIRHQFADGGAMLKAVA
jgi:ABC-type branched-subunit amino acid transport system substrate-binding protein